MRFATNLQLYLFFFFLHCFHADCSCYVKPQIVRFVDKNTVVLAEVLESESKTALGKAAQQAIDSIKRSIESYSERTGHRIVILRIPLPPTLWHECKPGSFIYESLSELKYDNPEAASHIVKEKRPVKVIASASYINYLVSNGVVLVARYWKPGRDESFDYTDKAAVSTLKKAFPGRSVVQVDVEAINYLGGGMNCLSQQQPKPRNN